MVFPLLGVAKVAQILNKSKYGKAILAVSVEADGENLFS